MTDPDGPLAAFECAQPGNRFSDRGALLAFGQRPDGTIVHIDDVQSGLACGCTCPACNGTLVAHKGSKVLHHFHHRDANACKTAGETALHLFAKQVLDERRVLFLPSQKVEIGGITRDLHPGGDFVFDRAVLELPMPGMVPDVVLWRGSHELLVEIYVTHKCGEEKIRRMRERGISAVEIDLSKLRWNPSRVELEEAILRTAPREWLANQRIEAERAAIAAEIELQARIRREKAERRFQELLTAYKAAKRAPVCHDPKFVDAVAMVVAAGYDHAIGIPLPGDYCFRVDAHQWQASIFAHFVLPLLHDWRNWRQMYVRDVWKHAKRSQLLKKGLAAFIDEPSEEAIKTEVRDFCRPHSVVKAYLTHLSQAGILTEHWRSFSISDTARRAWEERKRRKREREDRRDAVEATLSRILGAFSAEELVGFDRTNWIAQLQPAFGVSFAAALDAGDPRLTQMCFALGEIESMLFRKGKVVEQLLGLPLGPTCARLSEERRLADERRRHLLEAAAQIDADERAAVLTSTARRYFTVDRGDSWANATHPALQGKTPVESARVSPDGLRQALAVAERERSRRIAEFEQQTAIQSWKRDLDDHANRAYRDPALAALFQNTSHPRLGGKRPADYVVDKASLDRCLQLLPTRSR